jgi:hypothetical protein
VSSNSTLNGIVNLSESGFQVTGIVRNYGHCGPFNIPQDARGVINVQVQWDEICAERAEVELEDQTGEIFWGEQIAFTLPPTYTRFLLTISKVNGEIAVVNESYPGDWFTTSFDTEQRTLIVRPRPLEEALQ